ncbi:hypothetical protein HYV11_00860 [Candidatus Dependentiae bacterium]|nr:hypothetical protein [Candidatus Dependentiae bacterium]
MKKIFIVVTTLLCIKTINATHLLQDFEKAKQEALQLIQSTEADVKKGWDHLINTLENSIHKAKVLKLSHTVINQHAQAAEKIKETVKDKVSGQNKGSTRKKIDEYHKEAHNAKTELEKEQQRATHLSTKLNEHLEKSLTTAKKNTAEIVEKHNDAQKAVAKTDKEMHSEKK